MLSSSAAYAEVASILGYTLGKTTFDEVVKDYRLEPIPKHLNDFCDNCHVYALRGKDREHKSVLSDVGAVFLSFCDEKSALIQARIHVRPNYNITELTKSLVKKYKVQELVEKKSSIPADLFKKLPVNETISYQDDDGNFIFYVANRASPLLIYSYPDVSARESAVCFPNDGSADKSGNLLDGLVTGSTTVIDINE